MSGTIKQHTAADFDAVCIAEQFKAGIGIGELATVHEISVEAAESIIRLALIAQTAAVTLLEGA